MHYIIKLLRGISDEAVHRTFLRYGRGDYEGPAAEISVTKAGKIRVKSNYLYQDFFASTLLDLVPTDLLTISGVILGFEPLDEAVASIGVSANPFTRKKRTQLYQTTLSGTFAKNSLLSLYDQIGEIAYLLCNLSSDIGWIHKSKTKIPSAQKEIPFEEQIKFSSTNIPAGTSFLEELMPLLVPDFEEALSTTFSRLQITNTFLIEELVFPPNKEELSSSELRLQTKRKGILRRKLVIDDEELQQELPFIA